ncbi:MAG TPA: hypothetical protein EYP10_01625, partial [Armatimonadetes bacterium]|nr:hypothetical protein [Armatimonadota bacterium]
RETCITSSEGKLERDTWEKRFSWCDLSGKFGKGDNFSGIAIFDHPSNLNHPTTWANYYFRNRGFLNPTFPGARKYTIEPHKPLRLRYRLWIHRGDAKGGHVTDAYDAFIKPPSVKM